ncbi:hypothetical protein D3C87_1421150 [compost metagenome]
MFANELGRLPGSQFMQVFVQVGGLYSPNVFKFSEFLLKGGLGFCFVIGFAQNAHDALAEYIEHIVGVAAVFLVAGSVVTGIAGEFTDQLLQGDIGVLHQRLHCGDGFEACVEVDGVVDAENRFADIVTTAGGAAFHLLIENA